MVIMLAFHEPSMNRAVDLTTESKRINHPIMLR
jgi:hypothetical protein